MKDRALRYLLTTLLVFLAMSFGLGKDSPAPISVVFEGDSLTEGWTGSTNYHWVSSLGSTENWKVKNLGVGGTTCSDMLTGKRTGKVDKAYRPEETNVAVLWCGTNDVANALATPEQMLHYVQEWSQERRKKGFRVVVTTLQSIRKHGDTQNGDAERDAFNQLLREQWPNFADALADVAASPEIGGDGAWQNPTYFPYQKHLSPAGYGLVMKQMESAIHSAASKE